jgi:hypothetical protein
MKCDCGFMNRTCVICRHILRVLKEVLKNWGFETQTWHRRLLKKIYYEVMTTLKAVGGSGKEPTATIPRAALQSFCDSVDPTCEGVPHSGLVDERVQDTRDDAALDNFGTDATDELVQKNQKKKYGKVTTTWWKNSKLYCTTSRAMEKAGMRFTS